MGPIYYENLNRERRLFYILHNQPERKGFKYTLEKCLLGRIILQIFSLGRYMTENDRCAREWTDHHFYLKYDTTYDQEWINSARKVNRMLPGGKYWLDTNYQQPVVNVSYVPGPIYKPPAAVSYPPPQTYSPYSSFTQHLAAGFGVQQQASVMRNTASTYTGNSLGASNPLLNTATFQFDACSGSGISRRPTSVTPSSTVQPSRSAFVPAVVESRPISVMPGTRSRIEDKPTAFTASTSQGNIRPDSVQPGMQRNRNLNHNF